ncbi:MAG TPA: hypothetical protein VMZ53_05740 [Kofleriaceae bacterium]|nr:hypothetical protein [Kofleriaceae bacterium]
MDPRALVRAAVAGGLLIISISASGCGSPQTADETDANPGPNFSTDGGGVGSDPGTPENPPAPKTFDVALVPDGASGTQRVNFAVPVAPGVIADASLIKITAGGFELPAARRALAKYADGSVRSVQLQVDVDVTATHALTVELGAAGMTGPSLAAVSTTTTGTGNNVHPKVWALLPTSVLIGSGLGGTLVARADQTIDAWDAICDYDKWDTAAFLVNASASRDVWLYDRVTAMYRGYFVTGTISPLRSAYREAEIYRAGMVITNGVATAIAPPTANDDLKYYYAQNMAMHYLLTGDDRFREAAEAVSARIASMWNPQYNGADRFWTERHAGFTLLAHEWALMVTDDQAQTIAARSEAAVTAYLATQMTYPTGYTDQSARCFGHSATAHGEGYGYNGCSPWMSAILADALDQYARRIGGQRAVEVRASLAMLGRSLARDGRDSTGKPFYWMGEGTTQDEVDDYDEHWGESAYVIALAWNATGRTEASLKTAADQLVAGLESDGVVGQVRSFNWQCRSAIATPALLK